ncbi:MAG: hypothetical protein P8X74_15585 [Reinekea sp.]
MISICFSKIAGLPQFWGSKEESMVCALRRYGIMDPGLWEGWWKPRMRTRMARASLLVPQMRGG